MSVLGTYTKQPAETESYTVSYADDLSDDDTLVAADAVTSPAGLTLASQLVLTPNVKVRLSGGTAGVKYKVTITATTSGGRVLQDEFFIRVKDF